MSPLEQLGKDVAAALRPGPAVERRARQRALLLARPWHERRRVRVAFIVVPALAAALVAALLWVRDEQRDGVLEIAGDKALHEGRWLQVSDELPVRLRFQDGSQLELERKSTSRLGQRSGSDVRLTLESGGVRAWIEPVAVTGRRWTFDAGPYEVRVIGTQLDIAWSAERARLSVEVQHGRVQVRGGQLAASGLELGSGDRLKIDAKSVELGRAQVARPGAASDFGSAPARAPAPNALDATAQADLEARARGSVASGDPSDLAPKAKSLGSQDASAVTSEADSWKSLARAGSYKEALTLAERDGFDTLIERLPASDLALLADSARLAGKGARARQALVMLRGRFPGVEAAHMAAFRLGRLALAGHAYAEAARWFRTYLREAPAGALADEATGRLVEAQARAGARSGAEATAREYMRRFPGGPYESVARGILRGEGLAPRP